MIRFGLRAKLLLLILGLLLALTAGALLTVRHQFGQQLRRQAERELQAASHVLSSVLERSGAQLLDRGRILAELPSLQNALLKDHKQLEPLLMEVKTIRAANLLWATDTQGKVLASTGEYPPLGEDLSKQPLISAAMSGGETLGFDLFTGEWWLLLSLPVRKPSGEILGTITLSLLIGEAYLARLSELMGAELGFLWGENRLWSPQWHEGARNSIAAGAFKSLARPPQQILLPQGGRFLWMARLVTGGVPPIAAGPIALLGIPLDESVIQKTSRAIGWIAFLTLAIGAFVSVWTVGSITRPLKTLVADSQEIGSGNLAHRSQVQARDEVGELASSFNQMVERLQTSYNELATLNQTLEERVGQPVQDDRE
ncbi:MAG: HAMP domain-containing protein [Candidatus Omnitrophica bacterium]|nr:HAMP domain-containing protein [Candidatus Omnitrophota bacterium]